MNKNYTNIVMFIIGIILLWISRQYVQNHPAEKQWLISSYDTIKNKAASTREQIISSNWQEYKEKQQMISNYQEIYDTISNSTNPKCKELDISELWNKLNAIKNSSTQEYSSGKNDYLSFILDYKNRIDINCK